MHIAMIVDDERLEAEQAMLNRLSVGLIGEGARLTRIVPEGNGSDSEWEKAIALASRIVYQRRVVPWMRTQRVRRIIEQMDRQPPDLIFAVGRSTWKLARELSEALEAPVAYDICQERQAKRPPRHPASAAPVAYVAATNALADLLRRSVSPETVAMVPYGVALPPKPSAVLSRPEDSITIAVVGESSEVKAYRSLAAALERLANELDQLRIALELGGPHEHEIWKLFRSRNLLGRTSTIVRAQAHRTLLVQCDLVALPERLGGVRTLILELMGAGVPMVGRRDPYAELLIDGETGVVVETATADDWAERIRQMIEQPQQTQALARRAREWVGQHHRSSRQAEDLFRVFERLVTGGTYPFQTMPT